MAARRNFLTYVKAAFTWRWNLLGFGAGLVFSILSGQFSVFFPLAAAVEIAYLALLSTNPKFRRAVDVLNQETAQEIDSSGLMSQIKAGLRKEDWGRYAQLRQRCLALDKLGRQFRGPYGDDNHAVSKLQTESLERLLWIFLKLLYSQDALNRFIKGIGRNDIVRQIATAETEFKAASAKDEAGKLARSLEDKLDILKQRLANYDKAAENRELIAAEIDRIEQKVCAISELAVRSSDASDLTAQVDGIAAGVSATENAMRSLEVVPVFKTEKAPRLLETE
ncbi:MAG TPA: hypothetical protein PLO37_26120 [Candidatus Hydrogenedentes bacterium]|nr:hypothetical protein [Hyphomonadaceae bacterium]HPG70332.1 hypothetical protein [Candidatus Hydrogenedentota bacterium]